MIWWPSEVPTIQYGQFTLRPLSEADIDPIYQSCQDPLIPQFTTVPSPYTLELAEAFVRTRAPQLFEERKAIHWVLTTSKEVSPEALKKISPEALKVNGETFIGPFSIHAIEEHNHIGEVGYWINKSIRGHGYAAIGVKMITSHAFETLGFRRLAGIVDYDNVASKKVLISAGYEHEGLMKSRVTRADGNQIDMDLFAATLDTWIAPN
jgi:RimJ/RimL family protein N-acetyltransferase